MNGGHLTWVFSLAKTEQKIRCDMSDSISASMFRLLCLNFQFIIDPIRCFIPYKENTGCSSRTKCHPKINRFTSSGFSAFSSPTPQSHRSHMLPEATARVSDLSLILHSSCGTKQTLINVIPNIWAYWHLKFNFSQEKVPVLWKVLHGSGSWRDCSWST